MSGSGMARKLIEGELLTREEWKEACQKEILGGAWKGSYELFKSSYYEENEGGRCGYICTKHVHAVNKDEDGNEWHCGWGLHLDDLKPEFLTNQNLKFIELAFGEEELRRMLKVVSLEEVREKYGRKEP
jgi:hypothetical protein